MKVLFDITGIIETLIELEDHYHFFVVDHNFSMKLDVADFDPERIRIFMPKKADNFNHTFKEGEKARIKGFIELESCADVVLAFFNGTEIQVNV